MGSVLVMVGVLAILGAAFAIGLVLQFAIGSVVLGAVCFTGLFAALLAWLAWEARTGSKALPYDSYPFGGGGIPVYAAVTYTSLARFERAAGNCSITEWLETGADLEDGLVRAATPYKRPKPAERVTKLFTLEGAVRPELDAAAEKGEMGAESISADVRQRFQQAGVALSDRLTVMERWSEESVNYCLIDRERKAVFELMTANDGNIDVAQALDYPDELSVERFLARFGWRLTRQHRDRLLFERRQHTLPIAESWRPIYATRSLPVFLPHYEQYEMEHTSGGRDRLKYFLLDCALAPDERSRVMLDFPKWMILETFPPAAGRTHRQTGRECFEIKIGAAGMARVDAVGEAGEVRFRYLNPRYVRLGLAGAFAWSPWGRVQLGLTFASGVFASKLLEGLFSPAVTKILHWLSAVGG